MDDKGIKILLIEDNPDDVRLIREMLARAEGARFDLECADRLSDGLTLLDADEIDVLLLDLWLPDSQGLDTLGKVLAQAPQPPVVVLTSMDDTAIAVQAVRDGAQDYLVKGQVDGNLLARSIHYAIERRRAEKALRRSEAFSKSILNSMDDAIYTISVSDNTILECNRAFLEQSGLKEEEVIGKKCHEVTHRRSDPCAPPNTCPVRATLVGAGHSVSEHVHYQADGKKTYVEVSASPIKDQAGKIIQAVVVSRDITERRRAEEALRRSDEFSKTVLNSMNDAIYTISVSDNKILGCNRVFLEELGLKAEEVIGKKCHEVTHRRSDPCAPPNICPVRATIVGAGYAVSEHVHYRADGREMYVEVSACPTKDQSGKIIQAVVVSRDITERRRAEEELERTLGRQQRMLDGTVSALATMAEKRDPSTAGHQQRVAHLACAVAEEMGLSEERIEGIHVAGVVHDIGKIYVPAEVLNKSGALTGIEFGMVEAHPQAGCDILKTVQFPWPVAEIVLQHHERMDGSGYPQGLPGAEILVEARILAVADVFEAMVSHRPYRPAHAIGEAFEEISLNRGTLYDPEVVDACLKVILEKGLEFR